MRFDCHDGRDTASKLGPGLRGAQSTALPSPFLSPTFDPGGHVWVSGDPQILVFSRYRGLGGCKTVLRGREQGTRAEWRHRGGGPASSPVGRLLVSVQDAVCAAGHTGPGWGPGEAPRRRGRAGAGRAWEATGSEGGLLRSGGREELRNAPLLACPVPEHIHVTWNYGGQLSGWGPTRQLPADLPWFPETSRSSALRLPGHSD